jgi:peptide/nickel transport system permease protein
MLYGMRILLYSLKRILLLIPILLGISIVTFGITHILPGDPLYILLSPYAKEDDIQAARVRLGLDKPLYVQYGIYLNDVLHGDLGYAYRTRNPVLEDLKQRFPATLELTSLSLILAVVVAIPLGVRAAVKRDTWLDHLTRVMSVGGVSIPIFWTGVVLIYIMYYKLKIAPPPLGRMGLSDVAPQTITGMYIVDSILTGNWNALVTSLKYIALPAITLGFAMLAPITRITRNSMLEVLNSNYVRAAKSLGLSDNSIIYRDALRNAMLPVITSVGLVFAWSLGGEVLVEVVYSWPGLGSYAVNSILNTDYAPVQGFVLVTAIIYVVVNLMVDLLYTVIDPRISYR